MSTSVCVCVCVCVLDSEVTGKRRDQEKRDQEKRVKIQYLIF